MSVPSSKRYSFRRKKGIQNSEGKVYNMVEHVSVLLLLSLLLLGALTNAALAARPLP